MVKIIRQEKVFPTIFRELKIQVGELGNSPSCPFSGMEATADTNLICFPREGDFVVGGGLSQESVCSYTGRV